MGSKAKRGLAAAGTVVFTGAVNVATGMLTQEWKLAWWITAAVLVLVGGGLQAWLTVAVGPPPPEGKQKLRDVFVGRDAEQSMDEPGEQVVEDATVMGDVSQTQRRRGGA